jgi:hypothetical protein
MKNKFTKKNNVTLCIHEIDLQNDTIFVMAGVTINHIYRLKSA